MGIFLLIRMGNLLDSLGNLSFNWDARLLGSALSSMAVDKLSVKFEPKKLLNCKLRPRKE